MGSSVGRGLTNHVCRKSFVASKLRKSAIPNAPKAKKGGPGGHKKPVPARATEHKAKTRKIHSLKDPHWQKLLAFVPKREEKESGWSLLSRPERKGLTKDQMAAVSSASSLFVSPNLTYTFRLVTSGLVQTTTGVTTLGFISWDPSALTEYSSYLVNMFNEVRVRHAKITISGEQGAPVWGYALSSDLGYTSTAPANIQAVTENPDSRIFNSAFYHSPISLSVSVPSDYLWASTAAPVAAVNTGCYGQFQYAQLSLATTTGNAFTYMTEITYEFRSRT